MDVSRLSAAAIALATILIIFMDWVPTALNRNIFSMSAPERIPSTVIHGSLGVSFVSANLLPWKWIVLVGAVWYTLVLVQGIRNWWVAYLFDVYGGEINPESYRDHYASNARFLSAIGQHPVIPDVQHVLIHVAVLFAAVASWLSFSDLV
jgi:hypothetical protein